MVIQIYLVSLSVFLHNSMSQLTIRIVVLFISSVTLGKGLNKAFLQEQNTNRL